METEREGKRERETRLKDPWNVEGWTVLWYSWMQYEWRLGNYEFLETLFNEALRSYGDVRMWRLYLQYVRQCNPPSGEGKGEDESSRRQIIIKAYELALAHVGLDIQTSSIYIDYVSFINTCTLYEQQVQMDQMRKIYNRALTTPLEGIEGIWHEYDAYENSLNKLTAKKMLSDKSASYMAARLAAKELSVILGSFDRWEYALLPPHDINLAAGKYSLWMRWIKWEKANPLNFPEKSPALIQRIQYAYKCTLAVLRHYPELWFDYSKWLNNVGKREEAESILKMAVEVLPLDLLVNFAYADLLEGNVEKLDSSVNNEAEGSSNSKSALVVYETLIKRLTKQMEDELASVDETTGHHLGSINDLTLALIQQMNCCRRLEGIAAARTIFTKARKLPRVNYQLYLASAKMEYHCKRDPIIAGKIFELGMSKFGSNAEYVIGYLNHLIALNDEANARALFERAILQVPQADAMEIWKTFLDFSFRYGDQASIRLLLNRFREAYGEHPISADLSVFSRQYSYDEMVIGSERIWLGLQGGAIPEAIGRPMKLPMPFFIPDSIWELQKKLNDIDNFNGPIINPDGLVRVLQIVKLIPDAPTVPKALKPTTSKVAKTRTTNGAVQRKKHRDRLDDGDTKEEEPKSLTVRKDDLFAQRYSSKK